MKTIRFILSLALVCCVICSPQSVKAQGGLEANTSATTDDETLSFKFPPETIKKNARAGKFLPINLVKKPVSFVTFDKMYQKFVEQKKVGIYIGVIVDSNNPNWPSEKTTAHILNVQYALQRMMKGDKEKGVKGFAELYGARIVAVVPVIYDPKDRKRHGRKTKDGEYEEISVPVNVNDIILIVNDHRPKSKESGAFINTIEEMKKSLEGRFEGGGDKLTSTQYLKQLQARLKVVEKQIKKYKDDNTRLRRENAEIEVLIKQIPNLN